jgi:protein-export membrane protein SecD
MSSHVRWLIFIIFLSAFVFWISATEGVFEVDVTNDGRPDIVLDRNWSLGLDLVGGLRVLLQAELPSDAFTLADLRETANSVGRRVNALGLTEATIQTQGASRVLVELPGVTDREQAISTIQQTALLEFVDFAGLRPGDIENLVGRRILTDQQVQIQEQRAAIAAERGADVSELDEVDERLVNPLTGQPFRTVMTGSGLDAAVAEFEGVRWVIRFELTPAGGQIFGPFTAERIGQPLAIVLDGEVLSAPTIEARLDSGGVITGTFTEDEARQLALQLRSGALPIPLRVESAEQVGATLGQESVQLSIRAGVVGVIVVFLFMLTYYRVPGFTASLALMIFIALNMALFKLIPITLTLPAITGFLISIGTAVDGNVLIFERLKEEIRAGKEPSEALEVGFDRAWASIRDSNISTILICGVLFLFGQTPGASIVSGFAVTLAMGLALNLFTAVTVTRTFLYLVVGTFDEPIFRRRWLLGV